MREHRFQIVQMIRQNPAIMQFLCLMLVPVLIIFVPILLYGVLFRLEMPVGYLLENIPWWPILIVVGIAALLSLLHTPTSVGVQVMSRSQEKPHPASGKINEMNDSDPPSFTDMDKTSEDEDQGSVNNASTVLS